MSRFNIFVPLILLFTWSLLFAQPYGLTERVPNTSLLITTTGAPSNITPERVFPGLSFAQPIYLTHAGDGSNRIFIVEKRGVIKILPNDENAVSFKTFLNIRDQVNDSKSESGLLGMAFHPLYSENGKFYLHYNYGNLYSRVSEFRVSSDPDVADPASERELFSFEQPYSNHNGGTITFGPDGFLYIGFGDGGSGGDPKGNGQDLKTLMGAILRIDVDNKTGNLEYAIPPDNPYAGNSNGWREEIWAWGLRNPWRFSFDRVNGTLWCGDVGQGIYEEVDIITKGGNYGWNIMEGFHCYNTTGCDTAGLSLPVSEYTHSVGKSITGGYVYYGSALPQLTGYYIYGDFSTRLVWGLLYKDDAVVSNEKLFTCPSPVASFGEDEAGKVYIVGYDGKIYMIRENTDTPTPGKVPNTISASGLYSDITTKSVSPGIIPYSVIAPFWSDGASKERFLALPGTEQLGFSPEGNYEFPANSVLVKNFFLEMVKGEPESRKLVETRFMVKRQSGELWDGFSYQWDENETDATLLPVGLDKTFTITDPSAPGGSYQQIWRYPSRNECQVCHVPAAGYVLGFRTRQLNRDHNYDGVIDNQLRSYNYVQLFMTDIGEDYAGFPRLVDPLDESADINKRARSYLDANCAYCHMPGSTGRSNMNLLYSAALADMNIIDIPAMLGDLGVPGANRVKPGVPDESVIYLRMLDLGEYRMPQISTFIVDEQGAKVIADWIISLGPNRITQSNKPVPASHRLLPVFPNPFNQSATIRFELGKREQVTITVYNMLGKKITTLVREYQSEGLFKTNWDGTDETGQTVSSGLYIVEMRAGPFTRRVKMMLIK